MKGSPIKKLKRTSSLLFMAAFFCSSWLGLNDRYVPVLAAVEQSTATSDMARDADPGCKEERLQWFREARFGMFIHWGPYSALAGEWNGRSVPVGENAEWIMQKLKIPVTEYRELAAQFNPVKFDAEEWVELAKTTGMKYLVITAKHHDGFAMYHSRVSKYNVVDATPFRRDPMTELAEACQKQDIRFCFYYSHREDWDHPDAYGNDWDYDVSKKDFERYLTEKSKPQLREILTGYGPLGLIWFDRGIYTPEQANAFIQIVRELQPQCIINGRVGSYEQELMGDYQNMNDNGMPIGGIEEYWETPQTLNETWGYSKFDTEWKTPEMVIRRLVEIVSRGGNYLLNVGPTGAGEIPQVSIEILNEVGKWVRQNGESIYGTNASPFSSLPWGFCTVKGSRLYLHVFDRPSDGTLTVPGLRNKVNRAYLLADKDQPLSFRQEEDVVSVAFPDTPAATICTVLVVEIEGPPEVEPPVVTQSQEGVVDLGYVEAITGGDTVKRFNRKGKFHISKWTDPTDSISWRFDVTQPGTFDVLITYAANKEWQGREFTVSVGSEAITAPVEHTGDWYEYKTLTIGKINMADAGRYTLTVRPNAAGKQYLMYFRSMQLVPSGP